MGTGRFLGPHDVEVVQNDGVVRHLTSKRIFIDTGTRPAIPDLPGLPDVPFLTSDTIQKLDAVPSRLLVLGAGYIGLEFAQMMHRFGSKVTVLERGAQILSHEDAEVAEALANCLQREGIEFQLNAAVEQVCKVLTVKWVSPFARPKEKRNGRDLTCWSLWGVLPLPRTWIYPLRG